MRRHLSLLATLLLALLVLAPAAAADTFDDVFADFADDGSIDVCQYTEEQLREAKDQVPNDIEQYAPDFPDAIDAAIERRTRGGCRDGGGGAESPAAPTPAPEDPAAPATPAPDTPAEPAPAPGGPTPAPPAGAQPAPSVADQRIAEASSSDRTGAADAPAPLLLLAILGGALALGALLWGAARWWAWEPGWLVRSRHASAEAGWRASATWAEFSDWVRLGR